MVIMSWSFRRDSRRNERHNLTRSGIRGHKTKTTLHAIDLAIMNAGSRDNKISKDNGEIKKSGGKSVQFSRQMISDIFFIERIEKKHVRELFYSEKDIIGFQIDAMRKGERKARRNRERQVARSNSDGKVTASMRRDPADNDSSSMGKKSKKSSKKKKNKDDSRSRRRFSNDDAPDYEPRTASDESLKKKSRDPLDESSGKAQKKKSSSSKRRDSGASDSSTGSASKSEKKAERETLTQDQLLEKAMHWRKSTNHKEDSEKLDKDTSKGTNIALEPWTQDMLVSKAKEWGEAISSKVAASTPTKKPTTTSAKTKQLAFLLAKNARESVSAEKLSEEPRIPPKPEEKPLSQKIKEPPMPKKNISSNTKQLAFMLAREAKEVPSSSSLEDLPLSDNDEDDNDDEDDDEESMELSDLALEVKVTESMHLSQNDFLAEAMEKQKAQEEAANPFNRLRGIAQSIMVSQAFQNLTMEAETS